MPWLRWNGHRMSIRQEIKNDIDGAELLHDWLGAGGDAVHNKVAAMRAQHCIVGNNGQPCPHNIAPNWWNLLANFKTIVAQYIRGQLNLKEGMNLTVADEEHLHMCSMCGCCLKLKVHVPMSHIREHTPADTIKKMPDFCWIKKELTTYG